MQLFLLPDPHGAAGRAPWKTVLRTTVVDFLSKMSVLSVSVVMPHQLKANLTRISHVIHLITALIKLTSASGNDRASASYFRLVRPLRARVSVNKLGGLGGMLPQENF